MSKKKRWYGRVQERKSIKISKRVDIPRHLYWGIKAIAEMEDWTVSRAVVEIVKQVLDPEESNVSRKTRS